MPLIRCLLLTENDEEILVNVLWDVGSQLAMIKRNIVRRAGLTGRSVNLSLAVVGGGETETEEIACKFRLASLDHSFVTKSLEATTMRQCLENVPPISIILPNYTHLVSIPFTYEYPQNKPTSIDIILDTNTCLHLWRGDVIAEQGESEGPKVINTALGPILAGSYLASSPSPHSVLHTPFLIAASVKSAREADDELKDALKNFWHMETIGMNEPVDIGMSQDDLAAVELMERVTTYSQKERQFSSRLLFKKDPGEYLTHGYERALAIAKSSRRKYLKMGMETQVCDAYAEKIQLGFSEVLTSKEEIENRQKVHFLPSFPVFKEKSTSFKTRIVSACNAKTSTGYSINDLLYRGPLYLPSIHACLLRFKVAPIFLCCDLSRFFWRLKILSPDNKYLQYLMYDESGALRVCRSLSCIFGLTSSTFMVIHCVRKLAEERKDTHPLAYQTIFSSLYCDDAAAPSANADEALSAAVQLNEVFDLAGFPSHKWMCAGGQTNGEDVLRRASIPEERWAQGERMTYLGLDWDFKNDSIVIDYRSIITSDKKHTLRSLLACAARLHDPLGWCSSVSLTIKLTFRDAFHASAKWDSELEGDILQRYLAWRQDVSDMTPIRIPRQTMLEDEKITLCCFSDASKHAYSVAIYAKTPTRISLLYGKSRVAPTAGKGSTDLKYSIPRLELIGLACSVSCCEFVKSSLSLDRIQESFFLTDSLITKFRVNKGPATYRPFVANRLNYILSKTTAERVLYCCGLMNVSDRNSRSDTFANLTASKDWWNGPTWLRKQQEDWPAQRRYTKEEIAEMEENDTTETSKQKLLTAAAVKSVMSHTPFTNLDTKCSRFIKIQRVVCYIFRFLVLKCPGITKRASLFKEAQTECGPLKIVELRRAASFLYLICQRMTYSDDFCYEGQKLALKEQSSLHNMKPFLDSYGIIRATSRLTLSEILPYGVKYPIILPRPSKNTLATKIVLHIHEMNNHPGPSTTMFLLSRSFVVIGSKREIMKAIWKCSRKACHKLLNPTLPHAPLPPTRTDGGDAYLPFAACTLDAAGPFEIVPTQTQLSQKCWCIIYGDMHTRAIHQETVTSLSTSSFLLALWRFCSIRGVPMSITCDNFATHAAADRHLRKLYSALNKKQIQNEASTKGIQFYWGISNRPQTMGCVEALVRGFKSALFKTFSVTSKSDLETFTTMANLAVATYNNRPLKSPESWDAPTISPALLIANRDLGTIPCDIRTLSNAGNFGRMELYRRKLMQSFWKIWQRDYLQRFQCVKYAKDGEIPIKTGMVVVIKEKEGTPRGQWKLAKIVDYQPSRDTKVRRIQLLTPKNTHIQRHISDLCFFPADIENLKKERKAAAQLIT